MDKAGIVLELDSNTEMEQLEIKPSTYEFKKGIIRWFFTDFKPIEDISVTIKSKALIHYKNYRTLD